MIEEGSPAWVKWKKNEQLRHDYTFKKNRALKFMRCLKFNNTSKGRETLENKAQKWLDKAGAVLIRIEELQK